MVVRCGKKAKEGAAKVATKEEKAKLFAQAESLVQAGTSAEHLFHS